MKAYKTIIIESISIEPIHQPQQSKPNPYSNITFFESQQLKNQEIKGYKNEML